MRKPQVGETLYSLNIGNAARHRKQELTPVTVTKVGRKYFTVGEGWRAERFHINDWTQATDYSTDAILYETEHAYHDEVESARICRSIESAFRHGRNGNKYPLDALRQVAQVLALEVES